MTKNRKLNKVLPGKNNYVLSVLSSWFRTIVAVGIVLQFDPRGRNMCGQDESLQLSITDNIAHESSHRLCRYGIPLYPGDDDIYDATCTIDYIQRVPPSACNYGPDTMHCKRDPRNTKDGTNKKDKAEGKAKRLTHRLDAELLLVH